MKKYLLIFVFARLRIADTSKIITSSMKLTVLTLCILICTIPAFAQEIFSGINFGSIKKTSLGVPDGPQSIIVENDWDILWKSRKQKFLYQGINLKYGLNTYEGYKLGLGYKTTFGLNFNEDYSQYNIGIESTVGLSYHHRPVNNRVIDKYGFALETSLGIRFRFYQNYGARIMYNLSYRYFDQVENFNIHHGFSIGFVGPVWVNKKSIFKRRKTLKMLQDEKW